MRGDSSERGIYKRKRHDGEYWAYRFQVAGRNYSQTTDLKAVQRLLPAARRVRDEHLQRVKLGEEPPPAQAKRFSEAVEMFLEHSRMEHRDHPATYRRHKASLAALGRYFDDDPVLGRITPGDIESFKIYRRRIQIADVTLRKDLLALSLLFQFANKHRWVDDNPVEEVSLPSDRDSINERTVTPEEEVRYFAAAARREPVAHDVGRIMLWQGMRPQEVLALTVEDVDLAGRTLTIRQGKSRASRRTLYIQQATLPILKLRSRAGFRHLFPGGRHGYSGRPLGYSALWDAHIRVFDWLNIRTVDVEPFDIYSFRHTFATRFYEATKDLDKLARILGHANLATVRRYVNPSVEDLRSAMQAYEASCKIRATSRSK